MGMLEYFLLPASIGKERHDEQGKEKAEARQDEGEEGQTWRAVLGWGASGHPAVRTVPFCFSLSRQTWSQVWGQMGASSRVCTCKHFA